MKNLLKVLLLTPMAFSISGCKKSLTPIDVVIISGQSNGVGCTHMEYLKKKGSAKYQEYLSGYEDIKIAFDSWTKDWKNNEVLYYSQNVSKDNSFVKVMLGQGNSLSTFGPEIGIAENVHEKYANKLFLIKYACGASNLKDDWANRKTPMYRRLIKYVELQMENLKKMGYKPTIKAFCWMQGEGDSYDGYYQEYYENTKQFVGNFREDLKVYSGDKDVPFIDAAINDDPETWEYCKEVNEAKKKFANDGENNIFIDTNEAGMHTDQEPTDGPDKCHYDSESEVLLGKLFAEQFEKFLEK